MTESVVLIISTDPLAGALLGAAVELCGYSLAFPRDSETPRDALRRARPGVVLVDADHEAGTHDSLVGPAMMTGAAIAVYGTPQSTRDFRRIANAFGVECFELPIDHEDLSKLLTHCSEQREA